MYTREAIEKAVKGLQTEIASFDKEWKEGAKIDVVISSGNNKIGHTLNVSLPPVLTCGNCSGCMHYCYDIKACLQYTNVRKARAKNLVVLKNDFRKYFDDIEKALNKRRKNKFFRWHVSGDIPSIEYFREMVRIAIMHEDFRFWTYTKRYDIVNEYIRKYGREAIPENLSVMFSEWQGMPMYNPYGFPEFRVVMKGQEKPTGVKWCCGNCNACIKACSHCVKGETVYCMEH